MWPTSLSDLKFNQTVIENLAMDCCGGVVLGIERVFSPYRWMTSSSDGSPLQCAAHRSRTAADPAGSSRPSRGTRTYPATHPTLASAHTNVVSGGNDAIDTTSSSAPAHAAGPQHDHQHRSSPPTSNAPTSGCINRRKNQHLPLWSPSLMAALLPNSGFQRTALR